MKKHVINRIIGKKSYLIALICAVSLFFLGSVFERTELFSAKTGLWPVELQGVTMGMTMDEFLEEKQFICNEELRELDFRIELTEFLGQNEVHKISYYFTNSDVPQLYQVTIEYHDQAKLENYLQTRLSLKELNQEWKPAENVRAWAYQQKLVMVSPIPGSEWAI